MHLTEYQITCVSAIVSMALTVRRLFGGSVMDVTGPAVEPLLTPQQTAKQGGYCGPNIRKVSSHLGPGRDDVDTGNVASNNGGLDRCARYLGVPCTATDGLAITGVVRRL